MLIPFLSWGRRVDRHTLRADALAGLTAALLVLPQGVAFAALAGLPPEYGLYCAMVPTAVAAIWGSSWHAVTGPTNAVSLVVFGTLTALAVPGSPEYISYALTLAFMTGACLLALGVLRFGNLANFISDTVVVGFTAGVAVLIIVNQADGFLGIEPRRSASFLTRMVDLALRIDEVRIDAVLVGVSTIGASLAARRAWRRAPHLLAGLLAGTLVAAAINSLAGAWRPAIAMLAPIPGTLPPLSAPEFSLQTMQQLMGISIAVTVLALTEAVSIGRAIALRSGQRFDANQELIGQGMANLAASFFSAYPAAASFNRSGANYEAGARTPLASLFSAAILAAAVLALAPLAAHIPVAAVSALLFLVAWGLFDFDRVRHTFTASRAEAVVLAVSFAATLLLNLEIAILVGVMVSMVVYLNRTSHPHLRSLVPDPRTAERGMVEPGASVPECPQAKILRIEGSLYFGAVPHVESHLETLRAAHPGQKHLLVMSKSINFVDVAGAGALMAELRLRRSAGGDMYFYSLRKPVEELLARAGYLTEIGRDHLFRGKHEAFSSVFARLDKAVCASCRARIFRECEGIPVHPETESGPPVGSSPDSMRRD
ncbi:MAG: SulP family inorganic anion transporter [Burkholderiales bacterium]|nr:SulP family inorganic anion transporter [Burkholderiales bacterium]